MTQTANDLDLLRRAVEQRDTGLFAEVFERHRERLSLVVRLRIDRRVRARFDAEDVLQDTFEEAWRRATGFLGDPQVPVYLWLRYLVLQRLRQSHRQHMKTLSRDARREVRFDPRGLPESSSEALVDMLVATTTSASSHARRRERGDKLREVINALDRTDREILALRHFEQLRNVEVAQVLGITPSASSVRYFRALERLRSVLEATDRDL